MTPLYFDITDILRYARGNQSVVGIPRTVLNLVSCIARRQPDQTISFIYCDESPDHAAVVELFQEDYRKGEEYLLLCFKQIQEQEFFPSPAAIKRYLKPWTRQKFIRAWKKFEVYWRALVLPKSLEKTGLYTARNNRYKDRLRTVAKLPSDAVLVCASSTWFSPHMVEFSRKHRQSGGCVVQVVYDLIPIFYPEYYKSREQEAFISWLDDSFEYASYHVAISHWTARELEHYGRSKGKIPNVAVLPLAHEFSGFDRRPRPEQMVAVPELAGKGFVLMVGTVQTRKNNLLLLQVWNQLLEADQNETPWLVLAGKPAMGSEACQEFLQAHPRLRERVIWVRGPADSQLAWLYSHCLFTVFASAYEGWGLPVGESAWFGKVCLASGATSIPEVCGELADYFDPERPEELKARLRQLFHQAEYRHHRELQLKNAMLRTWDTVAHDLYCLIRAKTRTTFQ